jgi:PKD repeat protein
MFDRPTAKITVNESGEQHKEMEFDASDSRPGLSSSPIADFAWEFGDGETAQGVSVRHTYSRSGKYAVALTVTDEQGGKDSTVTDVEISSSSEQAKTKSPWDVGAADKSDAGKQPKSRPRTALPGQVVSTLFFSEGAPSPTPTEAGAFEPKSGAPLSGAFGGRSPPTSASEAEAGKAEESASRSTPEKSRPKLRKESSRGSGSVPNVFFQ